MDLRDFQNILEQKNGLENDVLSAAQKYKGMGENQLVEELMKNIGNAKQSGSYNYNELLEFANSIFPYLSENQRTKLVELLKIIR